MFLAAKLIFFHYVWEVWDIPNVGDVSYFQLPKNISVVMLVVLGISGMARALVM